MITIYSKDYCPYCSAAKDLIRSLGFEYQEVDITNDTETYLKIKSVSGMMTVPQIFVGSIENGNCLGGYSDIKRLHEEGKLKDLLNKK